MVVAISLNQWQSLVNATGVDGAPPRDGARVRRRLHQGGRPLPRARCDRRARRAVVRDAHRSMTSAKRSTSTACVGARTRPSRSCSTTTGGCPTENPVFTDVEQPGIGSLLHPCVAAAVPRPAARAAGDGAAPRHAHRRDPRRGPGTVEHRDRAPARRRAGRGPGTPLVTAPTLADAGFAPERESYVRPSTPRSSRRRSTPARPRWPRSRWPRASSRSRGTGRASFPTRRRPRSAPTATPGDATRWLPSRTACGWAARSRLPLRCVWVARPCVAASWSARRRRPVRRGPSGS